jgi:hypothetical protein
MRELYLKAIRDDNEPTRRALAMLRAVFAHVEDLKNDDPSEGFTSHELANVQGNVDRAISTIVATYQTGGK